LEQVVCGQPLQPFLPSALALDYPYELASLVSALTGTAFKGGHDLAKKIDLFHSTDHYIPQLKNIPVVATIHDVIGQKHPEWVNPRFRTAKNALFKKTALWAHHIITISEFSKKDITEVLGIPASKISVVPQGVSPDFFQQVKDGEKETVLKKYQLSKGFFVMVGTLQPRKNIIRAIQAHALLPSAIRKKHPLVVIGQEGSRTEAIKQALQQHEQSGDGRWLQYVPRADLFALLQSAQALLFPSLYEGFGLPVLEGFASQIPVIAANTTSIPEVAQDAAYLVNPLDIDDISRAMKESLEQNNIQKIQRGLVLAQEFSWQRTAQKTAQIYQLLS
jgi:alpha-1,3-rhamnosyl/mannosyltransferase